MGKIMKHFAPDRRAAPNQKLSVKEREDSLFKPLAFVV